jgi:hypothetical protein
VVAGSDVVVTLGTWLMVRVNPLLEVAPRLSVTATVNTYGPAAGGVPLSTPANESPSQAGRVAPASVNWRAPVPPVAARIAVYGRPTVHGASGDAVVIAGAGLTVTEYARVATALTVSVARMEKLNGVEEATAGAVPERSPAALIVSQPGRPKPLHVTPPVPPVELMLCEYATADVVAAREAGKIAIAGLMMMETVLVSDAPTLSVAFTVRLTFVGDATAPGGPLSTPVVLSDIPAGGAPEINCQENAPVPPETINGREQKVLAVQG